MNSQDRQPAGVPTGGQFAAATRAEAGVRLGDADFFPPAALTPRDVEHLIDNKGVFENGYTSEDINRVLGPFQGARLVCVWGEGEGGDYHGDSEFAGIAHVDLGTTAFGHRATAAAGSWRHVHPDVWTYLSDPETDIDPESIPSLLADEVFTGPDVDDLAGDGFWNLAPSAESCSHCGESLDDNEGYDGYCGTCADKQTSHEEGAHDDEPDDECPEC